MYNADVTVMESRYSDAFKTLHRCINASKYDRNYVYVSRHHPTKLTMAKADINTQFQVLSSIHSVAVYGKNEGPKKRR